MNTAKNPFQVQKWVAGISLILFAVKIFAWYLTNSVAILTDGLESIVNVIAGLIGLYSLYVSAKPRDIDHPYGHGKVEFISAAIEGTLIAVAGFVIIYEAIDNLIYPQRIRQLDWGIILISATALINYVMGSICVRTGRRNNSLALIASGKHLKSDTFTTLGIVGGLILLYFTKITWIDSVVALGFALVIIYTGYKIIRSSIEGIMDKADERLLKEMVSMLNEHKSINWIDLHNLRIIKYGPRLHMDCHLTVPWYFNVHEAHREIDSLSALVKKKYGDSVELFVHSDGCMNFSCPICSKLECHVRQHPFEEKVEWTLDNILSDKKHSISLITHEHANK